MPATRNTTLRTLALYAAAIPVLMLLPVLLWRLHLPFVSSTSGNDYRVFEIFAACVTLAVVAVAVARVRAGRERVLEENIPTVLFTLLACYFVMQVTEYRPLSSDWKSYERAAQAIIDGNNPYDNTGYLYPPLTALALASAYQFVVFGSELLSVTVTPAFAWQGVFYLYQCAQFFLVMTAIALSFRFAKSLGATETVAAVLVTVLFIFNTPLLRTLYFHQVNLWVLDLILAAVLILDASPLLAGLALAVATHVKLYAGIMLLPLLLMKRLRPAIWMMTGIGALMLLQTGGGTNTTDWRNYIRLVSEFPAGRTLRDNSVHGIVYNSLSFVNSLAQVDQDLFGTVVRIVTLIATCAVVFYFGRRWYRREQIFRAATDEKAAHSGCEAERHRLCGNLFDAIAMALMISPLVWEHHYILALPMIIDVALMRGRQQPWRVVGGVFLICAPPVFDMYPISYHRVAGLLLLLSASTPIAPDRQVA